MRSLTEVADILNVSDRCCGRCSRAWVVLKVAADYSLMPVGNEAVMDNDGCNGHIQNRWHTQIWFLALYYWKVEVVAVVISGVGVGLGGIKFRNSGNDGQLLVWCPTLSHNAHGGEMRGGRGAVGSFVSRLPSAGSRGSREYGGVEGSGGEDRNRHGSPACGRGTISGGCKYHTRIANTILGSVSVAATWKASTPGGG
jgi:hypothetical protein